MSHNSAATLPMHTVSVQYQYLRPLPSEKTLLKVWPYNYIELDEIISLQNLSDQT